MNDLYIYDNLLKLIQERRGFVIEAICYGPVADFTAFKELRAKLGELEQTEQDLKTLLNRISDSDD